TLESVNPVAYGAGVQPLVANERHVVVLETAECFGSQVVMVIVGAMLVGKIVETYVPGPQTKGSEMGCVEFGSSTVVLVFKNLLPRPVFERNSHFGLETPVKTGQALNL